MKYFAAIHILIFGFLTPFPIQADQERKVDLYLVNFTAEWCPNCIILEPRLEAALSRLAPGVISRVDVDMTNEATSNESFYRVDGTPLVEAYIDYVGQTGLAAIVTADTGEVITCVTRLYTAEAISQIILRAQQTKLETDIYKRPKPDILTCPPANERLVKPA